MKRECPHCIELIDERATVCPYCQSPIYSDKYYKNVDKWNKINDDTIKPMVKWMLIIAGIAVFVLLIVANL